jgi:hypothetical protein
MRKSSLVVMLATCLSLPIVAPSAFAQSVEIGRGGVRINPGGDDDVDRREATSIARGQGMVEVDAVSLAGRRWRVDGMDRRGNDMRVVIDSRTGDVISVSRDR